MRIVISCFLSVPSLNHSGFSNLIENLFVCGGKLNVAIILLYAYSKFKRLYDEY
jgi:hypothetical protein